MIDVSDLYDAFHAIAQSIWRDFGFAVDDESWDDIIDALEQERSALYASLGDPAFLRDGESVTAAKRRLELLDGEIAERIARWEALETIAST